MPQQIIGVDLGTYTIKAVILTTKPKLQWVAYDEEPVLAPIVGAAAATAATAAAPAAEAADAEAQGDQEETQSAEAPQAPEPEGDATSAAAEEQSLEQALEPWIAALERLMARMELNFAEDLVTFVPANRAMTIQLRELPFGERKDLMKILPGLLMDRLPLPMDKVIYEFRPLSRSATQHEALVAFARRDQLRTTLDELALGQVDPRQLTLPEWSLEMAAMAAIAQPQEKTFAVLDLGHEHTRVIVMERGKPVMARTIKFGGKQVEQAIAQRFKIPVEEAHKIKHHSGAIFEPGQTEDASLAAMSEAITRAFMPIVRDMRRTFQALYASDRTQLEAIYLCGGTSQLRQLPRFLSQEFGVEVSMLPLERLELDPSLPEGTRRSLVMAYSLALMLSDDAKNSTLNLRLGPFAYKGRSSYVRAQAIKYGVIAGVLLGLLLSALWMQQRDLNARRDAMRASVGKQTKLVLGTSVYDKKTLDRIIDAEAGATTSIAPKMSAYKLTYEIISRVSEGTKLELQRLEVDVGRNLIQVYGTTTTPQAVDKLVSDLEQLRCLDEIRKDKLKVKNENEATFELQIKSGCS